MGRSQGRGPGHVAGTWLCQPTVVGRLQTEVLAALSPVHAVASSWSTRKCLGRGKRAWVPAEFSLLLGPPPSHLPQWHGIPGQVPECPLPWLGCSRQTQPNCSCLESLHRAPWVASIQPRCVLHQAPLTAWVSSLRGAIPKPLKGPSVEPHHWVCISPQGQPAIA